MSAPSCSARSMGTRVPRPRRRHPLPHRPRTRVTDARSEGQESARSRPQPQGAERNRRAVPAQRPKRGRRARDLARSEHVGILPGSMGARPCPGGTHRPRSAGQLPGSVPVRPTDPPEEPNWETLVRRARGYRDLDYLLRKLRFMVANPVRQQDGVRRFLALGLPVPLNARKRAA